jgi:hypothetical protein
MRAIFLAGGLVLSAVSATAQPNSDLVPYEATTGPAIMEHNIRKMAACGKIKLEKRGLGTATALMHCSYDGFTDALRAVGAANIDLMDGLVAGEFSIAEKIDRHQISFVDGQAEEAKLEMRIKTEADLRLSAARQAAASEQAVRDRRQQYTVQAQTDAQARTRRLQLCEAAGWGMPTRTGSFAETLGNVARAKAYCEAGLPPPVPASAPTYVQPMPSPPTQTNCQVLSNNIYCTSQ